MNYQPKRLVFLIDGIEDNAVRVNKKQIVIGSSPQADISIKGDGISPIHATLELKSSQEGAAAKIYDLASQTGVFVNGKKTVSGSVQPGDEINIGNHRIHIFSEELSAITSERDALISLGRPDQRPIPVQDEFLVETGRVREPKTPKALEVVMAWGGLILDVKHFSLQEKITMGPDNSCDFVIPPLLGHNRFPFVSRAGTNYTLHIDPKMRGIVERDGKLISLKKLGSEFSLAPGDVVKILVGEVDFYVNISDAPRETKAGGAGEGDAFLFKTMATSVAFMVGIVTMLLGVRVDVEPKIEQIPDRLATILYQPEKYLSQRKFVLDSVPTEKVAPVEERPREIPKKSEIDFTKPPKEVADKAKAVAQAKVSERLGSSRARPGQREAKEGEGARAKGASGQRGSKSARTRDSQKQSAAFRPSPNAGVGRGGGSGQVSDQGNVESLKGLTSQVQDLLSDSAEKLGKSGSRLKGFGGFETQGGGGAALSGQGTGGGGTSELLGGLGEKGTGGGRVGTGKGASGTGNGLVGGQMRVAIRAGDPEEVVVMGSIDRDAIERAIRARFDDFRNCYEVELQGSGKTEIRGRMVSSFSIGSSGRVLTAGIASSSLSDNLVQGCVLRVLKSIQFPIPRGSGEVVVKYPFNFSARK